MLKLSNYCKQKKNLKEINAQDYVLLYTSKIWSQEEEINI